MAIGILVLGAIAGLISLLVLLSVISKSVNSIDKEEQNFD
jgi:hypothetical protein